MEKHDFLRLVQRRVAYVSIAPSTLRNQGKGVARVAREFLTHLDLTALRDSNAEQYLAWLNEKTDVLLGRFPAGAGWETARKAINVFLVESLYNRFLAEEYGLIRLANPMETPLDGLAGKKIKEESRKYGIPLDVQWTTIKGLTKEKSDSFQAAASKLATIYGTERGYLDLWFWRPI